MIDEIDQAQAAADIFNLAAARRAASVCKRKPNGRCFNCGEKVRKPRRWCDAPCRDEWQKDQQERR